MKLLKTFQLFSGFLQNSGGFMLETVKAIVETALNSSMYELEDRFDRSFESGLLSKTLDGMNESGTPFYMGNIWISLVHTAMKEIFGMTDGFSADFRANLVKLDAPETVMFLDEKKEMFYLKTGISIE